MVPFRKKNQLTDTFWRMQLLLKARKKPTVELLLFVLSPDLETFSTNIPDTYYHWCPAVA